MLFKLIYDDDHDNADTDENIIIIIKASICSCLLIFLI